jgi:uncharacterized protein
MSDITAKISVKVMPNAGKNEISGLTGDVWRIKIAAPPDKGKANKELIEFLSKILEISKDSLTLIKGHTSHNKIIAIYGLTISSVNSRLSGRIK